MKISNLWDNFIDILENSNNVRLANRITKAAFFVIILVSTLALLARTSTTRYTDLKVGSIATKKVVAPFTFFILKTDQELEKDRKEAISKVPHYFDYRENIALETRNKLEQSFLFLRSEFQKIRNNTQGAVLQPARFESLRETLKKEYSVELPGAALLTLYNEFADPTDVQKLHRVFEDIKAQLMEGVSDTAPAQLQRERIAYIKNDIEESMNREALLSKSSVVEQALSRSGEFIDDNALPVVRNYLEQAVQPTLVYDIQATEKAEQDAIASVSRTKDMVFENERIVDANERIDEEIYQKLYSLEEARRERSIREGNWQMPFAQIGKLMLISAVLFIVGLYLYSFRKLIFNSNKKLLLITIVIVVQMAMASIISGPLNWPIYMIPTTLTSMLLAILIDPGIAFVVTVANALILGGVQGGGYDIALMTIVSGMVSIFAVYEIRTRNQIFQAILYIGIAYLWLIGLITFMRFDTWANMVRVFGYNLLPNAVFAPFITYMLIGIFERGFDITTDVRLLELSDLNHPLLKKLSIRAPGTFHHSMVVGNLAESAAKEIGENSLLARVGAYYHDIGKMDKPEYFIENQMDANNRHSKLKPNMSALILASHVKIGLDMAEKYNMPQRIQDFIAEHHGTSLMYFFYNKAVALAGDKDNVNESDFRYPGPKPQSKATAIVMLADSVEAATRSLKNPSPSKIRAFVEGLVHQRYRDGELDECDLTFKELKQITDAFLPILYGVFQHRIEYPDQAEKSKPAKTPNTAEAETQT